MQWRQVSVGIVIFFHVLPGLIVMGRYLKEFDVAIDSQMLVLAEILKWCQFVTKDQAATITEGSSLKRIAFHTTHEQYFSNLELLLERFGYDLQDSVEVQHFEQVGLDFCFVCLLGFVEYSRGCGSWSIPILLFLRCSHHVSVGRLATT